MNKYKIQFFLNNGEKKEFETNKGLAEIDDILNTSNKWIIYNMHYINTDNVSFMKVVNIEEEEAERQRVSEENLRAIESINF
jgi:hypothetical protein